MFNSILFIGRKNCIYSEKLKKFINLKSKKFTYIESKYKKQKIKLNDKEKYDYIFCFRSFLILKKSQLNQAIYGAINFHPGTPDFRGIGCINYAIYKNVKKYGSTCHLMDDKIDNGKIIDVSYFKIDRQSNLSQLLRKTHKTMFIQAINIINYLFKDHKNLIKLIKQNNNIKWSKKIYKIRDLEKLYRIDLNKSKTGILNQIRSTYLNEYRPYILHKKIKYYLDKKLLDEKN
jgi:methionyl-tRNA formyltransferase